jgi:hypothetical protein
VRCAFRHDARFGAHARTKVLVVWFGSGIETQRSDARRELGERISKQQHIRPLNVRSDSSSGELERFGDFVPSQSGFGDWSQLQLTRPHAGHFKI